MRLNQRLRKLEDGSPQSCPGCAPRQITIHHSYTLPDGTQYLVPPAPPPAPPCTCKPPKTDLRITKIVAMGWEAESPEAAEADYWGSPTAGTCGEGAIPCE